MSDNSRSTCSTTRRNFLGTSAMAGVSLSMLARDARAVSANEKITVGVMGIHGRGYSLAMGFASHPACQVAYLADVDTTLFDREANKGLQSQVDASLRGPRAQGVEKAQGKAPKTVQDFRRILDDKSVDALVIATPDHWHALATILGCQAGKDVYVEKPASYCPWEGRQAVNAARKYNRVVQLGTQTRSAPYLWEAKKYITDGKLGRIHLCRIYNIKHQSNFPMAADSDPPATFDWNIWNGPAPEHQYNATFPARWHGFWRYSGGDIINDGIHQIDIARWLCGVRYPKKVWSAGVRYGTPGVDETPETQVATFEFDNLLMNYEQALYTPYCIKADMVVRDTDIYPFWPQNAEHVEIYGEKGMMCVGRHGAGWQVFGRQKKREPVIVAQSHGRFPDAVHKDNFVDCIRSRQRPNADIEEGHWSTLLAQFANISYRLNSQTLLVDPQTESFTNSPEGNALLKRPAYRAPWVVPEQV